MKELNLRILLRAKREVIKLFGFSPIKKVSFVRSEKPPGINFGVLSEYSPASMIEIHDPRSNQVLGHYFQARKTFTARDVILEPRLGLIYSVNGELISESTNWPIGQLYNSFPWNPRNLKKSIEVENALYMPSTPFGHWLMEDLPILLFALSVEPDAPILVLENPPKYVSDFLSLLNRNIIYLQGPVRVKSLIMVQKNQDSGWPHPHDLKILEDFNPFGRMPLSSPTRKIYASRRNVKRSPKNEIEIEKLFERNGFEIVQMDKLDLLDEIKLMSETCVLAGVHGSALSNVIWMQKGSKVLEIVNENYWTEAGHRLCFLRECQYEPFEYFGEFESEISLASIESWLLKLN